MMAQGGGAANPLEFSPSCMCYFPNLKDLFWGGQGGGGLVGAVLGWGQALSLLPVGAEVFEGLTWQSPAGAAGRRLE